jgi:hypothetical protein
MLEHVRGINGIGAICWKRQTIPHVQPQVNFIEGIGIDIHKALKILRTATKVKMSRPVQCAGAV